MADWTDIAKSFGEKEVSLGVQWSYNLRNDPKRLAFVLSRAKFAAKLIGHGKSVLEIGCGEGICAPILAEATAAYAGLDYDEEAVLSAKRNFSLSSKMKFHHADVLREGLFLGKFDAVVTFDVLEHIDTQYEACFFQTITRHLHPDGVALVGTPNIAAFEHASPISRQGHINNFSHDRLRTALEQYFETVFMFGANDEVIHTGFPAMTHYLLGLACGPRAESKALRYG